MASSGISVNIADRWHLSYPPPGAAACRCGRGRNRLYPSAEHGKGDRWQVQWRDPRTGRQKKANRPKREGADPGTCADAYADEVRAGLRSGSYVDPAAKQGTFGAYVPQWRTTRIHDEESAAIVERRLRLHVLEDPGNPGRTPRGGPALGHLTWAQLQQFTSLTQAWISGLTCSPSTARHVIGNVSSVFASAMDDGLIGRDPTRAKSIARPKGTPQRARAWTEAETAAMEAALPPRYRVVQRIGPSAGLRQGEMFALDAGDIDFLARPGGKVIRVGVQVIPRGGRLCYGPLKNRKPHDVPVADELVADISAHLAEFGALEVTLPWHDPRDRERHGQMVTRRLVVHTGRGAVDGREFTRGTWKPALAAAGLIPPRERGAATWGRARERGTHAAWRHTAASMWLRDGVEVTAVAEWLGDTVATVTKTYLHFIPSSSSKGRAAQQAYLARLASARPGARNVPGEGSSGT